MKLVLPFLYLVTCFFFEQIPFNFEWCFILIVTGMGWDALEELLQWFKQERYIKKIEE